MLLRHAFYRVMHAFVLVSSNIARLIYLEDDIAVQGKGMKRDVSMQGKGETLDARRYISAG